MRLCQWRHAWSSVTNINTIHMHTKITLRTVSWGLKSSFSQWLRKPIKRVSMLAPNGIMIKWKGNSGWHFCCLFCVWMQFCLCLQRGTPFLCSFLLFADVMWTCYRAGNWAMVLMCICVPSLAQWRTLRPHHQIRMYWPSHLSSRPGRYTVSLLMILKRTPLWPTLR